MSKTQYLNEEKYQTNKKKITIVAVLVLIIGLLIGGGLIATGLIKNSQTKLSTEEKNEVQTEIDGYNTQISSLKSQRDKEFLYNHFSENYYNLENEIDKLEGKIDTLEDKLNPDTSYLVVFYIFGGFIVIVTFVISGIIYTAAKGREIEAFYAQQQMPLAKEVIEEMAPTVGNAVGEIAKGIKKGLKDEEKNSQ